MRCHVEGGSVKSRRHDDLYGVRREQEKFGLKGGKVPVTNMINNIISHYGNNVLR